MIEIDHVTLKYRKHVVLSDVTFQAEPGHTIGLLGLNGSGKSTLLSAITGAKHPESGRILLNGKTCKEDSKTYLSQVGYVTQENALIEELSAMDNLRLWTSSSREEIMKTLQDTILSILGVHTFLDIPVRRMSGGMKKRLSIATVLINQPRVLLLDEPLAALDILAKQAILSYINTFRAGGGLTFVASHEERLFEFCDDVYLLKNGSCKSLREYPADASIPQLLAE